jgi:hypothetical protein
MSFKNFTKGTVLSISAVLVFSFIGPNVSSANNESSNHTQSNHITKIEDFESIGLDLIQDQESIEILQNVETKIIEDNKNVRIVESTENGVTSRAVYNKKSRILTNEIVGDKSTKVVLDLDKLEREAASKTADPENSSIGILASTLEENTFSNMEYTITYSSPQKWQLRRPQPGTLNSTYYKNVTRTSSNSTTLDNFKSQVDQLNDAELKFIGSAAGAGITWLASLVIASLSGGAGVATALVAAGITGAAYNYGIAVERHAKNALHYYHSIPY